MFSVNMNCAETLTFQLVSLTWFCCMFVRVRSHVMPLACHMIVLQLRVMVFHASPILCISIFFLQ